MQWRRNSIWALACLALASMAPSVCAQQPTIPPDLPRYDLDVVLDVNNHLVKVREIVTWTNTTNVPARELVFESSSTPT